MCNIVVVNKKSGAAGEYIGRPSPLGNPFIIGRDGSREDVIHKYRQWLMARIKDQDPEIIDELARLRRIKEEKRKRNEHLKLQCWCAPLPCHGDIIKEVL